METVFFTAFHIYMGEMFDLYIRYILVGAKVNPTECRVGKLRLLRSNDLNLNNHMYYTRTN